MCHVSTLATKYTKLAKNVLFKNRPHNTYEGQILKNVNIPLILMYQVKQ